MKDDMFILETVLPPFYITILTGIRIEDQYQYLLTNILDISHKVFLLFGIFGEDYFDKRENQQYFEEITDDKYFYYLLLKLICLLYSEQSPKTPCHSKLISYVKVVFPSFAHFLDCSTTIV